MDEKALFLAALELEDEKERERFLEESCKDNPSLKAQVLSLLAAHRESDGFLGSGDHILGNLNETIVAQHLTEDKSSIHPSLARLLGPTADPKGIGSLGHYTILEVLGQGAFGIVLRAFDEKLHRVVAIKVLSPEVAATSPPRKRFLREARSAASVKHENVVQVYSVEEEPIPYLVMEYIDGPTLQQKLDNTGPLDMSEVVRLSWQIASGLAAAHAKGLIHRDIKPGNILIESGVAPKVKITDFGLARAADDASMTRTGVIAGTPMYMAPEQALGRELDHRADLFSLGSVMYQMASGRPPFRADSSVAVLLRVANDTPRAIREIQSDVPSWFAKIVSKLHEKKPEDRYQTAREVAELLGKRQSDLADGKSIVDEPSLSRPIQSNIALVLAGVMGLVLLGGFAVWKVGHRESSTNGIAAWAERVSKLSADEQVTEFTSEMKRRNPKWDGKVEPLLDVNDQVWNVAFDGLNVSDIGPIMCFKHLKSLKMLASEPNAAFKDISPLSQCKSLELVYLHNYSVLRDISPLRELPIRGIIVSATEVSDLEPLKGKPLNLFNASNCRELKDLSALQGSPLDVELALSNSGVKDFSALRNSKVTMLFCTPDQLSQNWETIGNWPVNKLQCFAPIPQELLKQLFQLPTLREIDFTPVDQYLAKHGRELATKTNSEDISPWIERTASLSAEKQVSEFTAEMKRRNPKWDEKVESKVEEGRVVEVRFDSLHVKDIAPIACFRHLKTVNANASQPNDELIDISPLAQCKSIEWVSLVDITKLRDISPLRELPLIHVLLSGSAVSDLEALRGKYIQQLNGHYCRELKDLSPLQGAPLSAYLGLSHSGVTDFSVLRSSQVTHLNCLPNQLTENWDTVRGWPLQYLQTFSEIPSSTLDKLRPLKTLKEIDGIPVDQYFKTHGPKSRSDWNSPSGSPEPLCAPVSPEDAKRIQSEWAKFKNVPVETESSIGLKFAVIPPGEFQKTFHPLRAEKEDPLAPTRSFRITYPYSMATTEVTVGQFRQFVEATGYKTEAEVCGFGLGYGLQKLPGKNWSSTPWKNLEDHPVVFVTDKDATEFCRWLSQKEGATYRLPTEAEWLHASRGGSNASFVFGDTGKSLYGYAHSSEDHDNTPGVAPFARVGRLKPNSLGLRDVLGNVWERTSNSIANPMLANYLPMENPIGGPNNSINGWSWADRREQMRLECYGQLVMPHMAVGFRVLKELEPSPLNNWTSQALVLRPGAPMSPKANVDSPTRIERLRSWTVEVRAKTQGGSIRKRPTTDGYFAETDGHNGRINLWSSKLHLQEFLFGHDAWVHDFTFSPDGKWLASNTAENIFLWNAETKQLHAIIGQTSTEWPPSFSSDSKRLAVIRDQIPSIIDLETGRVNELMSAPPVDRLKWNPNGKCILFGTKTSSPHLLSIDLATNETRPSQDIAWGSDFAFSPDGQHLALVNFTGEVQLLNATTYEVEHTFSEKLLPGGWYLSWYLGWSPKSDSFVVANETATFAFDAKNLRLLSRIPTTIGRFVVTEDGNSVINRGSGVLEVYDNSNGSLVSSPKGNSAHTTAAYNPKTNRIFSGLNSRQVTHDARTGERIFQSAGGLHGVSPDGSYVYFRLFNPVLSIYDSETGEDRFSLAHNADVQEHPVWSPDSKLLCTGTVDGTVTVWSLESGKVQWKQQGHQGKVWALAWSPNGKNIATFGEDKKLVLWDATTGKLVSSSESLSDQVFHHAWTRILAFSPDSELLWLSRMDKTVGIRFVNGQLEVDDSLTLKSGNGIANLYPSKQDSRKVFALSFDAWPLGSFRICDTGGKSKVLRRKSDFPIGSSDDERFFYLHNEYQGFVRSLDVSTNTYTGTLYPIITGNHWVCISPDGHYKGSQDVEEVLVYVAMLEDGSQHTYTPKEFAEKFGWENDPERVSLTPN